jgi:hypothetical protein
MLRQAGHRLVVSPWFAAGAGVVIATGVMIYTPHTNFAIDIQKCQLVACTKLTPQGGPPPVPVGTGAPMPAPSKASLPKGMTFWYQPGHSNGDEFSMWIEVRARGGLGQWKLSFRVPGAKGIYVYWPRWTVSGTNGVTVNSYYAGTESAVYTEISADESDVAGGLTLNGDTALFQIRGTGAPNAPTTCTYNGASCTFKLSSTLATAGSQGSG